LKQIGPTTDLPQGEHQAQGAAAFPAGISMPRESSLPRGRSILRGEQHAQEEQLAHGEKHTKGGAACPGRAATKTQLQQLLSVKSKIIFSLALNLKIKFKCLVLYVINVRFRLMGTPGITHELCSYLAVLSAAYIPFLHSAQAQH
jgi:hypothetical protein